MGGGVQGQRPGKLAQALAGKSSLSISAQPLGNLKTMAIIKPGHFLVPNSVLERNYHDAMAAYGYESDRYVQLQSKSVFQ